MNCDLGPICVRYQMCVFCSILSVLVFLRVARTEELCYCLEDLRWPLWMVEGVFCFKKCLFTVLLLGCAIVLSNFGWGLCCLWHADERRSDFVFLSMSWTVGSRDYGNDHRLAALQPSIVTVSHSQLDWISISVFYRLIICPLKYSF